ncbi:hypothetical protein NDJ87_27950 [Pseudomonas marginalis]|nr:hypothetical protein [Pseudomonas marginalis]
MDEAQRDCCRFSNSPCHESALLILLQAAILAGLSGQTARFRFRKKSQPQDGLMSLFNLLPALTDVDLSLLDPTSYFSRCLCSGFFLPKIKRGAISAP